ncbi:MAG: glycosyltransferase family 4 protein [Sandaracinus sp.]|nr:glycosyltransferase family 4 protein [Sandaracinus sp.]
MGDPRVLIVAEHASARFGGEAILPVHYFRVLRRRGIEAWMIVHERTRDELEELFPADRERLRFIPDTKAHVALWKASEPVSPKEPSLLYDLGAPVVIGPMNGGMTYPDAFAEMQGRSTRSLVGVGRLAARSLNRAIPGKLHASTLVAANPRTREALPPTRGKVIELVENGVDLSLWNPPPAEARTEGPPRFVFLGRLVDWKAVDVVIDALARVPDATLEIIGDGYMRPSLEARARELGVEGRVEFVGWVAQAEAAVRIRSADALVLPSVFECGGAVVLEAMATGLPCIATRWGGPADYLDETCGILVDPASKAAMVEGFAAAMRKLGTDPALRARLGAAARRRIEDVFDWERKVDRMLEIYEDARQRWN